MVPRYLPPAVVCSRWFSEPLRVLNLNTRTFYENKNGYPVLHKEHKALIHKYMRLRNPPWLLLSDVSPIPGVENPYVVSEAATGSMDPMADADTFIFPTPAEANRAPQLIGTKNLEPLHHLNILRRLQQEQPARSVMERFGSGYQDYLQAPLQPLTDNLESITYEVFEKDPVKYALYTEAIERALVDWRQHKKSPSGPNGKVVIAVVGAGRGPLVSRALVASERTGVPIELWALEKNPNAFVLLERHNTTSWNNQVHLVRSDMRSWKGPVRVIGKSRHENGTTAPSSLESPKISFQNYTIDVLVSELLGSFADNELSPECLDGITHLLNPIHGLSIPRSYTSYLTPIGAPKLHADILTRTVTDKEAPSTPYVVMLHAADYLSSNPTEAASSGGKVTEVGVTATAPLNPRVLPAWSFNHSAKSKPAMPSNEHNIRQNCLRFPIRDRGVCHGLAGYFESVLYPGVELSTHPHTAEQKSAGMMSWFPIYFPLKVCIPSVHELQSVAIF